MSTDFVGREDENERRKLLIEEAVEQVRDITSRLDEAPFDPKEILTVLLPEIILDQVEQWGLGEVYRDLDDVVVATQALLNERAEWEDGEEYPIGMGCRWWKRLPNPAQKAK
jgi:hypothetical protein